MSSQLVYLLVNCHEMYNLNSPSLSLHVVDQIGGWPPPIRCPSVSERRTVPVQPADPGYWPADVQQPGRDPAVCSFAVTVVMFTCGLRYQSTYCALGNVSIFFTALLFK